MSRSISTSRFRSPAPLLRPRRPYADRRIVGCGCSVAVLCRPWWGRGTELRASRSRSKRSIRWWLARCGQAPSNY